MSTLSMMGCDVHLDTIAAAIVDGTGAEVASATVPNTTDGWDQLVALSHRHQVNLVGIEGASGYGRRLAQTLNAAGVPVAEVPTRVTARTRRVDGAGKTDPGDARTIARAAARGDAHRWADQPALETIRVLVTRRNRLVTTQTGDINQLRALIAELDPEHAAQLGRLRTTRSLKTATQITINPTNPHHKAIAALTDDIATSCINRLDQIRHLEQRIADALPPAGHALINNYHGCGLIVAAQLLAEIAGTDRFETDAHMASWAGTAPLDASSGRQQHHRLNRHGNRQANRAIHTIIITQLTHGGPAATYINRRIQEGKTKREAIRAAKRHLTRRIWKTLHHHNLT